MNPAKQKAQPPSVSSENKEAAKSCLHNADKYLKDGDFTKATEEVLKAKELDPSNAYIYAFQDRIEYFEQLKKKEAPQVKASPPPPKQHSEPPVPSKPPAVPEPERKTASTPQPPPAQQTPVFSPPPPPKEEHPAAPIFQISATPAHATPIQQSSKYTVPSPSESDHRPNERMAGPAKEEPRAAKQETDSMLQQMKRQIEELSHALEQEKVAREEISSRQLQGAVKQFRTALEKGWINGAPPEKEAQELHQSARSLGISEEVEHSITREVKLEMYSKAVKEMIAKRKLLKSSSSTMDWLRKVYQVTIAEYLENESKFLLDLVADQFKGTLLFVTSDANAKNSLVPKLKMAGYAVVVVPNPEGALEKIDKINPNIIVCETEFPAGSLSGIKFLHVLRVNAKFSFLPFILLCEAKEVPHVQSSELKPNEGFIKKPLDFDELTSAMNEKLAQFREYISSL